MTEQAFFESIRAIQTERMLRDYLGGVRARLADHARRPSLADRDFLHVLERAVDATWEPQATRDDADAGWQAIDALLEGQITQLAQLEAEGVYDNPYRGFGVGGWYNFDVAGYLECACRGAAIDPEGTEPIGPLDWESLEGFFECGRCYE